MTVYLVGAGPGDPGLITVRGAEVLAQADVVIFDRLVSPELLDLAPAEALRIDVGKRPGLARRQEEVTALLVTHGASGACVVRLKGGDPFVFGRGGEEAQGLLAAGVPFEVVPGVSSAFAVPASAGVPVTHRGLSTSVTVVTGRVGDGPDSTNVDWDAVARVGGTIVVLMGLESRADIAARLLAGGLAPDTPVAAVHWGTTPARRTVRTTLAELPDLDLDSPTTIVVGAVAALDLVWGPHAVSHAGADLGGGPGRPLAGVTVAVTRAAAQATALSAGLSKAGATVLAVPVLAVVEAADGGEALRQAVDNVASAAWVVLTSANAVDRFASALGSPTRLGATQLAVVGPATAKALAAWGLVADLVAAPATAEALVAQMPDSPAGGPEGARVLYPRAEAARDVVVSSLGARGWTVDDVVAYRTVMASPEDGATPEALDAAGRADVITFTSPSAVAHYLDLSGGRPLAPVVACIGPVTAEAARQAGLHVDVVADEHSAEGLVAAVVAALSAVPSASRKPR